VAKSKSLPSTSAIVATPQSKQVRKLIEERLAEERMEEERMQDVLLLLQGLARREEVTVKMILSCLYDVGTVNLINKKVRFRPLNRLLKSFLGLPKPLAIAVGFRWFKNNCPELIANWLQSKVNF
jgi:hypothetical protein